MASSEAKNQPQVVANELLLNLAGELGAEWRDLGRHLKLKDPTLDNIEHRYRDDLKEIKYRMLIHWKEANGKAATRIILAKALSEAGRTGLAEKLKNEEFKSRKRPAENEFFSEQATSYSKRQPTTEVPPVNQFLVEDEHMTADMRKKKTQFVKELRKKYRNLCGGIQPVPFLRDKYDIDELFVESGIKFLKGKPRRGKEQEQWTELKNYKMVFTDPRVKSNRRIIDGEPGYGKSTLFLQITHDWCNETSPMNDVDILILLRLRQFKNIPTVYSAIKKFLLPKDSKLTEEDIKDILDSSSTLILLDGYDEYPGRGKKDNDIEDIIREDMFQNHDVILTTRTLCLPPDYSRDTKLFRLTGYDDTARDIYIRNVVAGGSSENAERINQFFKDNPVPVELSTNPLFFAMISFMVHLQERFLNLKTVTDFFRHIIKCFCTHKQVKVTEGKQHKELDHSALDKITFEGLGRDSLQISWNKNELMSNIGKKLYNEYVGIGLLIEEDGYDYDTMEYKTEASFSHKLFVEWFAAHYLIKEAARQEAEFEPWPYNMLDDPKEATSRSQRKKGRKRSKRLASAKDKEHMLKSLDPDNVHYMYRYACGLNGIAALKIIEHLGKNGRFDKYTMLCIAEWGGNLEEVTSTITWLCSRGISIDSSDSVLLQKSAVELIKFASDQKIPIEMVRLYNCLDVGSAGNLRLKPSNLPLPIIDTSFRWLHIHEFGREMTEEETDSILQYSAMCLGLQFLQFDSCLLPRYIKGTEFDSMSLRSSSDFAVLWDPDNSTYLLNFLSGDGQWEDFSYVSKKRTAKQYEDEYPRGGLKPITEEQYQEAVKVVREAAEQKRQYEQEDATASSHESSNPSEKTGT